MVIYILTTLIQHLLVFIHKTSLLSIIYKTSLLFILLPIIYKTSLLIVISIVHITILLPIIYKTNLLFILLANIDLTSLLSIINNTIMLTMIGILIILFPLSINIRLSRSCCSVVVSIDQTPIRVLQCLLYIVLPTLITIIIHNILTTTLINNLILRMDKTSIDMIGLVHIPVLIRSHITIITAISILQFSVGFLQSVNIDVFLFQYLLDRVYFTIKFFNLVLQRFFLNS